MSRRAAATVVVAVLVLTALVGSAAPAAAVDDPTIGTLSRLVFNQGSVDVAIGVTGTGFVDGATAAFGNAGLAVDSFVVTSPTQATLTFDVLASLPRGIYSLTITNPDSGTVTREFAVVVIPPAGGYTSLNPSRLLDTRNAGQVPCVGAGNGAVRNLQVTGVGGVPSAAAVDSVALNVTVTGPTAASFLTVYPAGGARPLASNLNFGVGQTTANQVIAKTGTNGVLSIFNNAGCVDVVIDVVGWFAAGTPVAAGGFVGLTPTRLLDTRAAGQTPCVTGPGARTLQVAGGTSPVPLGADAVALNVTVAGSTGGGFVTVFPSGAARPTASNLNFTAGQIVPNGVIASVGAGGAVELFNSAGCTDLVVDVVGWFTDAGAAPAGGGLQGLVPLRLLDTRIPADAPCIGPTATRDLTVLGVGPVPADGVDAVALNVTVAGATEGGFLTVYPTGATTLPVASSVNFVAGQVVPNAVLAKVGADGRISIFNHAGCTQVVVDVVGWVASTP